LCMFNSIEVELGGQLFESFQVTSYLRKILYLLFSLLIWLEFFTD
jgi:hypothetical protein